MASIFLFKAVKPVSVSVQAGIYYIPAGYYARVVVNLEGSATFTINGTIALRGTQNGVLASDNLKLTDPGSGYAVGALYMHTAGGAPGAAGAAFNETTDQKTVVAEYNLPTGTAINGSGVWRAVVELYLAEDIYNG